jgi:hypothetical protein
METNAGSIPVRQDPGDLTFAVEGEKLGTQGSLELDGNEFLREIWNRSPGIRVTSPLLQWDVQAGQWKPFVPSVG